MRSLYQGGRIMATGRARERMLRHVGQIVIPELVAEIQHDDYRAPSLCGVLWVASARVWMCLCCLEDLAQESGLAGYSFGVENLAVMLTKAGADDERTYSLKPLCVYSAAVVSERNKCYLRRGRKVGCVASPEAGAVASAETKWGSQLGCITLRLVCLPCGHQSSSAAAIWIPLLRLHGVSLIRSYITKLKSWLSWVSPAIQSNLIIIEGLWKCQ